MQENTAAKTVRGLSLAAIILAALSIVICAFSFASSALIPGVVNAIIRTDAIPVAVESGIGSTKDAAKLKIAVDSLNDPDLDPISDLLGAAAEGDVQGILSQTNIGDPEKLQKLADSFASLTDQQINEIVLKVPDIDAEELKKARDAAASTSPEEIDKLYTVLNGASTEDIIVGATGLAVAALFAIIGWILLCSVISLIAGILGMKNAKRPEKLGAAFVWSIIGAVAGAFSGRVATMVILIINAIYIDKARKFQPAPTQRY